MLTPTLQAIIRPFLLYGGLFFTITRRAVTAGMILLLIHLFLFTVVPVRGDSMDPTLADGTFILVDQLSPRLGAFKRGEIIALRPPLAARQKFIKRIIGLPGESVAVREGGVFFQRSGDEGAIRLREPYLAPAVTTVGDISFRLGPVEYFVMGDNRKVSLDSRGFGPVPEGNLIGKAFMILWPIADIRLISHFDPTALSL